jgi:hypothetical protein
MERSEVPDVPEAPDGITIIGLARDGQTYTQHYFDSRGVVRTYAMTFDGEVWQLLRESPDFSPLSFRQRFVGRIGDDGDTIRGAWEKRTDAAADWELDFPLTYRRSSAGAVDEPR